MLYIVVLIVLFVLQHRMYIKNGHSCYMSDLSADERLAVHTDDGIRNLEVNTIVCFALSTFVRLSS